MKKILNDDKSYYKKIKYTYSLDKRRKRKVYYIIHLNKLDCLEHEILKRLVPTSSAG
jgi:hypothetical protein